ncbi:MAG: hypothetical protein ABIP89_22325, partial [Polyangiaceae bacterium]
LAVGTAVGLAIPSTRREDEWMGDVRDNVLGKAQDYAQGALDRVEDVAKHVAEDATRALKEKGNGNNPKSASTF